MGRGPCHFNREVGAEHSENVTAEHGLQNGGVGIYRQEEHSSRRELPGQRPEGGMAGGFKKQKSLWPEQHGENWDWWGLQRKVGG